MSWQFGNPDPTESEMHSNLLAAEAVCQQALAEGKHPFGAVLVAPDHHTVLLQQGNIDTVNHAESTLARRAAEQFDADYLWNCTLYTTVEPCAMCAATSYWANIGRIVFGVTEADLLAITGAHDANPTMNLPCREVFNAGQKPVRVWGPVAAMKEELLAVHQQFWQHHP
ncbi:nucleoside deaminase [Halioxenophilus sp. WMMB6]|uniref:nucleoside deaminase n=1 Tax=Halioxenophilus sp. WMMB6 TaxID=3073815 RepID=UPI00295E6797|nr:nucleoside deaminase [Halioxenophilus sp. WMMB6]